MKVQITEAIRGADERGFSAAPVGDEELKSVYNLHIVSLKPGAVRGNHYHEHQTEWICVLGGPCKFVAVDRESGERMELVFDGESCPQIVVGPGVSHAAKNTGEEAIYLLCYADQPLDRENPDVVRSVVLE